MMDNSFTADAPENLVTRVRVNPQERSFDSNMSQGLEYTEDEEAWLRLNRDQANEESELEEDDNENSADEKSASEGESESVDDPTDSEKIPKNRLNMSDYLQGWDGPSCSESDDEGSRSKLRRRRLMNENKNDLDLTKVSLRAEKLERQMDGNEKKAQIEFERRTPDAKELLARTTPEFLETTGLQFFFGKAFSALLAEAPKPPNPIRFILEFGGYKIPTDEENEILKQEVKKLEIQVAAKQREVNRKQQYVDDIDLIYGKVDSESETSN